MVNSVSNYSNYPNMTGAMRIATSSAVLHHSDVENMVKFLNGQPITGTSDPSIGETVKSTIPMLGIVGAWQAGCEIKENNWNINRTIKNVNNTSIYKTRNQALQAGKNEVVKKFKDALKGSVAVDPKRGFLGKCLDKLPGYKKLRASGFGQLMSNKGTGAGWMAVFDGAIETLTQVVPTFQQAGAGAGFKQIAKSGTKVLAGTVGWVAGDAVGRGVGAALGTAICPGIGTAIGSFVGGFIGGIVGSAVAGKAAKAVTGKSELEKLQDNQVAQASKQIEDDAETKAALAQQVYKQAETILAQDPTNKDALAAKASAENTLAQLSQQTAQTTQTAQQAPAASTINNPQTVPSQLSSMIPTVPGFNGLNYDLNQYHEGTSKAAKMTPVNPFAQQMYKMQQQPIQA